MQSDEQKNPNVKYTDISKAKARAASENWSYKPYTLKEFKEK